MAANLKVEAAELPPVVDIKRWCRDFSESRTTFYNLVNSGQVRIIKNGRRTLIPRSEYMKHVRRLEALAQ